MNHLTHPWKVESYSYSVYAGRSHLIGRAMFKTREEAEKFQEPKNPEGRVLLRSQPGDTEFA